MQNHARKNGVKVFKAIDFMQFWLIYEINFHAKLNLQSQIKAHFVVTTAKFNHNRTNKLCFFYAVVLAVCWFVRYPHKNLLCDE